MLAALSRGRPAAPGDEPGGAAQGLRRRPRRRAVRAHSRARRAGGPHRRLRQRRAPCRSPDHLQRRGGRTARPHRGGNCGRQSSRRFPTPGDWRRGWGPTRGRWRGFCAPCRASGSQSISRDPWCCTKPACGMSGRSCAPVSRGREEITVSQFRELIGSNRRWALALLNHFDGEGFTIRRGDVRALRVKQALAHRVWSAPVAWPPNACAPSPG